MHPVEQLHVLQIHSLHPLMQIGDVLEDHGEHGKDQELAKGNRQLPKDDQESERLLEDQVLWNQCPANLGEDYVDDLQSMASIVEAKGLKAKDSDIGIVVVVFSVRDESDDELVEPFFVDHVVCELAPLETSNEHQYGDDDKRDADDLEGGLHVRHYVLSEVDWHAVDFFIAIR